MIGKVFGAYDSNVKIIENAFGVNVYNRIGDGVDSVVVMGDSPENVAYAAEVVEKLRDLPPDSEINDVKVGYYIDMVRDGFSEELTDLNDCICLSGRGKPIKARTVGQKKYVDAIKNNTIVLGVGPAGTGKTFLAVAMAVKALRNKQISRIILTRPAIEAGEKLGFLPGDLQSKIDPYLRPLYDALYEMMGQETYSKMVEKGVIEIAPLAYMRGRTLDDSFIILDEAQNSTFEQMKMFLTRLGTNSKAVVTGDPTQIDLGFGQKSGLVAACEILEGIEDIKIHHFTEKDVVRHRLVQKIILAYDKYEKTHAIGKPKNNQTANKQYKIISKGDKKQ
jgi:phosphate starvation-inducible PhoH-like protein